MQTTHPRHLFRRSPPLGSVPQKPEQAGGVAAAGEVTLPFCLHRQTMHRGRRFPCSPPLRVRPVARTRQVQAGVGGEEAVQRPARLRPGARARGLPLGARHMRTCAHAHISACISPQHLGLTTLPRQLYTIRLSAIRQTSPSLRKCRRDQAKVTRHRGP